MNEKEVGKVWVSTQKFSKKRLEVKVTPEEKNNIELMAKAGNYNCTSRYALNQNRSRNKRDMLRLCKELNKIGVNINQIAKHMNTLSKYESSPSAMEVLENHLQITSALISLDRQLKKVREDYKTGGN